MDEIWELYNENGEPTGEKWHRKDAELIPKGRFYLIVSIWTVTEDNKVLVTLRAPTKEHCPLKWENSGGAALFGETSRQAAVRELFEETGIKVNEDELFFLNRNIEKNHIIDNYIVRRDVKLSDIRLQEGENCDKRLLKISELDEIINDGSLAEPIIYRLSLFRREFDEFILGK